MFKSTYEILIKKTCLVAKKDKYKGVQNTVLVLHVFLI